MSDSAPTRSLVRLEWRGRTALMTLDNPEARKLCLDVFALGAAGEGA